MTRVRPLTAPVQPRPTLVLLHFASRLVLLAGGLFLFAAGIVLTLRANVGVGPWDVLHQGLTRVLPISFGQANILVGVLIVVTSWRLGIPPRLGTLANMLLIGAFADLILTHGLIPDLSALPLAARLPLDALGVLMVGFGCGLYIRAGLGAGPRDGLMLALTHRLGFRVAVVRAGIELTVIATGLLLGGTVGVGTLIFALGIGPAIEASFRVLGVPVPKRAA